VQCFKTHRGDLSTNDRNNLELFVRQNPPSKVLKQEFEFLFISGKGGIGNDETGAVGGGKWLIYRGGSGAERDVAFGKLASAIQTGRLVCAGERAKRASNLEDENMITDPH